MDLNTILNDFMCPIIVVICLCVGYIIKHLVPSDAINRFIPLIVGVLGVLIGAWLEMAFTPQILAVGLVSGLASTGFHQLFKNFINKESE